MKKPILGIVGGIGSGKSLVAEALGRCGGHLIDADQLGHEALRQPDIKNQVVDLWGPGVVDHQGEINRQALGRIVFAEVRHRHKLEALVFPYIERRIGEEMERGQADPSKNFIVLDAAIMLETGWSRVCDKTLFVDAPREMRLQRLKKSRGWSEGDLAKREKSQWPLAEKRKNTDAVLVNDQAPEKMDSQVQKALETMNLGNYKLP